MITDITARMRPEVARLQRSAHGGQGWRSPGLEDFSANLNPLGPPKPVETIIERSAREIDHYPDDTCARFKEAVANRHGLRTANILPGAGSSEIIRLFPEVFLQKGDRVLMPWPTFAEYRIACWLMGAEVVQLPLVASSRFRPDVDAIISSLDRTFKCFYLCNPNNPTGMLCWKKQVLELVEECERLGVIVFLDETLLELLPVEREVGLAAEVEAHSNLLVIRSLTKSFAIPGMRLGYGLGSASMISCLEKGRQTWNVGWIEQEVGAELLANHQDHVQKGAELLAKEKVRVHDALIRAEGVDLSLPDAFYFFLDLRPLNLTAAELCGRLRNCGILVRDCSSFGRPFNHFVRFCVKTPEKNDRLLKAFREALCIEGG